MENISISNLFPGSIISNKPLDVKSIYNYAYNKRSNEKHFTMKEITSLKEQRLQKIYDEYRKLYRSCIKKIRIANKLKYTTIIFEVPEVVFNCSGYVSLECMDYIKSKLDGLGFKTEVGMIGRAHALSIRWDNIK